MPSKTKATTTTTKAVKATQAEPIQAKEECKTKIHEATNEEFEAYWKNSKALIMRLCDDLEDANFLLQNGLVDHDAFVKAIEFQNMSAVEYVRLKSTVLEAKETIKILNNKIKDLEIYWNE